MADRYHLWPDTLADGRTCYDCAAVQTLYPCDYTDCHEQHFHITPADSAPGQDVAS